MKKNKRRMVRLLAVVLAVLLVLGTLVSVILSTAYAEEAPAANRCELKMEYLGEEQALRMSQRLVYTNESEFALDRAVFYAPANLFRRQTSLPYDGAARSASFPAGYLPGGVELEAVRVNGEDADWGYQGADEAYLRVACALEPGQSAAFEFEYYLLLTQNAAFLGLSSEDWRLSGFYFSPASLDGAGEFICNAPLSFTRYVDSPAMDFSAEITLPDSFALAGTGAETSEALENHRVRWEIHAQSARDFSLCFSRKFREFSRDTDSGVNVRLLTNVRGVSDEALSAAESAIEACEAWFGPAPFAQLDIVQADCASGPLSQTACLWLPASALKSGGRALERAVYYFVAQQYFGCRAYARPSADAWLSDSLCEYLSYLLIEEMDGYDAYLAALNAGVVDALQLTIPGGLNLTSDAALLSESEYQIIIRDRGAAVFHELRTAMGREELIAGLRLFYEAGLRVDALSEMDLVDALDRASGESWEAFLTDWAFNIGEYVNQSIDWLD